MISTAVFSAFIHVLLICGIKYVSIHFKDICTYISCILILYFQKKSLAILPYVILTVINVIVLICFMPMKINLSATNADDSRWEFMIGSIIGFVFALICGIYYALCMYSLYSLIRDEEKKRKNYKNCDSI